MAETGGCTWSVQVKANRVRRAGILTDSGISVGFGRHHFIHAGDDDYMFRTETKIADSVAIPVNVDQKAVGGKSVGAH